MKPPQELRIVQTVEVCMKPNFGRAILGGFAGTVAITLMMYLFRP